ncbi:MAG: B12-binding domain-containing radical SAM protein, partial [Desulfobacteraceae bacterium]|nr:B12-binding domain-containing radical SAM protein [Desulfobacteraceae bacterium]
MIDVLLIQLPLPQLNFSHQTANIPFGAACLKQATEHLKDTRVEILPQAAASYWGDAALLSYIDQHRPKIIGFTVYLWNVRRTLWLARRIKNLYPARIIAGGPEVTPDNALVQEDCIDFRVYGEGEALFAQLLQDPQAWLPGHGRLPLENYFTTAPSPYFTVPLAPELEGTMLLETMRGCPHRCAYCYYNKSHTRLNFKEDHLVLDGVRWALSQPVKEVYFLDPSLNSRPGLKALLKEIARLNSDHQLAFISEMRADAVDEELADLLAAAGFKWLEVGLQSTNPAALKAMRRKTDLARFVQGARRLIQRGVDAAVDLIVGLPGDDPAGFDRTTQFVVEHDLHKDIQVFPLSLIPGTEFRRRHKALGLTYDPEPPYTVISTPGFTSQQMIEAFDLAEERFDVALYPLPDLDLTYQSERRTDIENAQDINVQWPQTRLNYKIVLNKDRGAAHWSALARQVTQPYQLLIPPSTTFETVLAALPVFTEANPYTPLELVFFSPP